MKILNLFLVLMLGALQLRLWTGSGGVPAVRDLRATLQEQLTGNGELLERNQALAAEVIDLKTGLDAVEERARSEMGMVRSGETFFQILDSAGVDAAASE